MILKEDFIDAFKESRKNDKFIPDYDFSLLPEIIGSKLEKVTLICRNKIGGIEVGEWTTDFLTVVEKHRDIFRLTAFEKYTNPNYKISESKTEEFISDCNKIYPIGDYDFSQTQILEGRIIIPVKIKCNKCGKYFWQNPYYFIKGVGCSNCSLKLKAENSIKINFQDWKEEADRKHGENRYDYSIAETQFKKLLTKLTIKCNVCGSEFEQTAACHLRSNIPCPKCRLAQASLDSREDKRPILEILEEICGPDYDFSDNNPVLTLNDSVTFKNIKTGKVITQQVDRILHGGAIDPTDTMSTGALLTYNWLTDHNIDFQKEYVINNKIQGREQMTVRIDFRVLYQEKEIWIEVNGAQHYHERNHNFLNKNNRYTFQQNLNRDNNVKEYCKENNILFVEIPYTEFTYKRVNDILNRIILNGESPDFIKIPEITYIEPNNKPENYGNV